MKTDRSCVESMTLLADFAVGALTGRQKRQVEEHLKTCDSCMRELRALQRAGQLLDILVPEQSPDLWPSIEANLRPRKATPSLERARWWLSRSPKRSGLVATLVAVILLAIWIVAPLPNREDSAETYVTNHASMSWRDPFADKAGLGLAATMPIEVRWEESK